MVWRQDLLILLPHSNGPSKYQWTWKQLKIQAKLNKFWEQCYISKGVVALLMSLFDVTKGEFDVLNDVLWALWFSLPTVDSMFRKMDIGYWSADNDFD